MKICSSCAYMILSPFCLFMRAGFPSLLCATGTLTGAYGNRVNGPTRSSLKQLTSLVPVCDLFRSASTPPVPWSYCHALHDSWDFQAPSQSLPGKEGSESIWGVCVGGVRLSQEFTNWGACLKILSLQKDFYSKIGGRS